MEHFLLLKVLAILGLMFSVIALIGIYRTGINNFCKKKSIYLISFYLAEICCIEITIKVALNLAIILSCFFFFLLFVSPWFVEESSEDGLARRWSSAEAETSFDNRDRRYKIAALLAGITSTVLVCVFIANMENLAHILQIKSWPSLPFTYLLLCLLGVVCLACCILSFHFIYLCFITWAFPSKNASEPSHDTNND